MVPAHRVLAGHTFSPDGATFAGEEWTICEPGVTHVRVAIKPDKGGKSCRAALTSLPSWADPVVLGYAFALRRVAASAG